ncbi:hypothetical protein FB451DRAFT_1181413 [Mycena latifolia]|nr:hypothetical protein FB451DRAFT_1181413 [Mycena latifolia]
MVWNVLKHITRPQRSNLKKEIQIRDSGLVPLILIMRRLVIVILVHTSYISIAKFLTRKCASNGFQTGFSGGFSPVQLKVDLDKTGSPPVQSITEEVDSTQAGVGGSGDLGILRFAMGSIKLAADSCLGTTIQDSEKTGNEPNESGRKNQTRIKIKTVVRQSKILFTQKSAEQGRSWDIQLFNELLASYQSQSAACDSATDSGCKLPLSLVPKSSSSVTDSKPFNPGALYITTTSTTNTSSDLNVFFMFFLHPPFMCTVLGLRASDIFSTSLLSSSFISVESASGSEASESSSHLFIFTLSIRAW